MVSSYNKIKEATGLNFIWDLARATKTNRGIILRRRIKAGHPLNANKEALTFWEGVKNNDEIKL
ncbi:isochorismatase [Acetomicrobium sp.]|uniref:isochorismatase n=1 Tax=Acetomicrobium sp. TaxID=1872099 RepID=UPI001BD053F2|nr:isochorismatase [Acetomicrobium sp.]